MGSNSTYSDVVNPLLNGFLTGQLHALSSCCSRSLLKDLALLSDDLIWKKKVLLQLTQFPTKTLLKRDLLCGGICTTASLGIFEILSKRLRNGNEGQPLSLRQEACCGLISGATAIFVWQPLLVAYYRVNPLKFSYMNWATALRHIVQNERASPSTLWRGSGAHIASLTGMLASYDRTLNYLSETQGLRKEEAQLSASVISGFFAAASAHSFQYLGVITKCVHENRAYRHVIPVIRRVLTPHSGINFYSNFFSKFKYSALYCMVQFSILEHVRAARLPSSKTKALHS